MSAILTTDSEITEAIAQWLDAQGDSPTDAWNAVTVARFDYGDGTRGSIRWQSEQRHVDFETDRTLGPWFIYTLRTATHTMSLMFTPEFFRDSAEPIVPLLHKQASEELHQSAH